MAKKVSKKVIIPITILLLITFVVGVFVAFKPKKKTNNDAPPVSSPVKELAQIKNNISKDVANNNISVDYNGNFSYYTVVEITFEDELSISEQNAILKQISNCNNKNGFALYLDKQKSSQNEKIILNNGNYTKQKNGIDVEKGLFYGNTDLSYVYVEKEDGKITISEKPHSLEYEISLSGYWITKKVKSSSTIVYLREKVYYGVENQKYFYVTYSYKMQ